MWDVASIEGEKLYLAACGNSTEQPIGDFLMLTMSRYEVQSLWHGNVLRVLSSVVDCTFNPGYVERPRRWGLAGQYNSGFPASRSPHPLAVQDQRQLAHHLEHIQVFLIMLPQPLIAFENQVDVGVRHAFCRPNDALVQGADCRGQTVWT